MNTLSIRTRFMLLVGTMSILLTGSVGFGIYSDAQQTIASTKNSLRTFASAMVSTTGGRISNARQTLERLSERPLIRQVDPENCDGILKDLLKLNPDYANVTYTNIEGIAVCSAVPQPDGKPVNVGKAPWFQKFLMEQRFMAGDPFFGPISRKWVSVLSAPIWNARHEMVGGIQLPLDLRAYDPKISTQFLPAGTRYGFVSEDGILIWRNVDPEGSIGTRSGVEAARRIVEVKDGEFEGAGSDGVARFFSVVPMPETGWIAFVGVPVTEVHAAAKQRAIAATTIAIGAIALLIALALAITRRITGPIAELERATRSVLDGNLAAKVRTDGPREVTSVATAFNAMTDKLEASTRLLEMEITERKQAEAELVAAKTAAETANVTKSRFLAAASHDLRQPMQAISLFTEALVRTDLTAEQKRISGYLSRSTQSLGDLLNTLLDISKLDAGVVEARAEVIAVDALAGKIDAEFSPIAAEKSLRFKLSFPFREMALLTDGKLLMSLLGNLIGNAIKYTSRGGILVAIRRRRNQALIQVWDTGIGIDANHLDTLYEEYFQIGNPERDREKGLGLGLAVVKRVAKLLDTEVVCRSRPGSGSVFEFRLPLTEPAAKEAPGRIDPISTPAKPASRHIVLVENDHMVGTATQLALQSCGMTVTRYKTAEGVLADSGIADVDFYISDLRLPGMSGVEFLDAVQRRTTKPIKALIVSGDTAVNQNELMRSTSWQVLLKPVELQNLLAAIESQDSIH